VVRHARIPNKTILGTVRALRPQPIPLWRKGHYPNICCGQEGRMSCHKKEPQAVYACLGFGVGVASTRLLTGRQWCRGTGVAARSATEPRSRALSSENKLHLGVCGDLKRRADRPHNRSAFHTTLPVRPLGHSSSTRLLCRMVSRALGRLLP
jgi:hypothetical protein